MSTISLAIIVLAVVAKTSSLLPSVTIMTEAMSKPPPPPQEEEEGKTTKTVYLIRHAESEENRRLGSLRNAFSSIGQLSLPSMSDIRATVELVNIPAQVDSSVSATGHEQIKAMADILSKDNFVQASGIQLVVHSPLERARETCFGMLQCRATAAATAAAAYDDDGNNNNSNDSTKCHVHAAVKRVEELHLLTEKTPMEWIPGYMNDQFRARIAAFEDWLQQQPETVVAVVGHSQYFCNMLNLPYKFGNCDVWKVQFDYSLLARCRVVKDTTTTSNTTSPQQTTTTTSSGSVATTIKSSSFASWMPSIMKRNEATSMDNGEQSASSSSSNSATTSDNASLLLPPQWSALELLYKCSIVSKKDDDDAQES